MEPTEFEDMQDTMRDADITPVSSPAEAVKPAKVVFDNLQRARIDTIVREAMGRASREARTEAARLQKELDTLRSVHPATVDPGTGELATQLADAKAQISAYERQTSEAAISAKLLEACGDTFVDTPLAVDLLRRQVRMTDGKLTVLDSDGNERLNSSLERATLQDAVRDLAEQKKYLARGTVKFGTGSTQAVPPSTAIDLAKLFGRNAGPGAGAAQNLLAKRDIAQWRRLRDLAKSQGLI